jgi:hypothetical protein
VYCDVTQAPTAWDSWVNKKITKGPAGDGLDTRAVIPTGEWRIIMYGWVKICEVPRRTHAGGKTRL